MHLRINQFYNATMLFNGHFYVTAHDSSIILFQSIYLVPVAYLNVLVWNPVNLGFVVTAC